MGSRVRFMLLAAAAVAALASPLQEHVTAQAAPAILISEFRFNGPSGVNDEFIELFNASSNPVAVNGWSLRASNNNRPPTTATRLTLPNPIPNPNPLTINPGCFLLIANNASGGYSGSVAADLTYSVGFADDGGVALLDATGTVIDQAGIGVNGAFGEGTRLPLPIVPPLPPQTTNRSFERNADATFGFLDTNNNATDFTLISPSRPQNSHSTCVNLKIYYPHEIQGAGLVSPIAPGTTVTARGVVTARTADGFFIQTDSAHEDADANTSEGLFVFATDVVQPGHLVNVTGKVNEARSVTRIDTVTNVSDLGVAAMPDAHVLTSADLSDTGSLTQLERFEGMRVSAPSLTAVSATANDGSFFAVLSGQPRPFREPGVMVGSAVLPCALPPCNVPVFDGNPERLRVDSDGLLFSAQVLLSTGATMSDVTGPLDFGAGAYTLLPDTLAPAGGMAMTAAPAPSADQFTLASLNRATAHAAGIVKASQAVLSVLNSPDVIGIQGVDTLGALLDLAAQINSDNGAPLYDAYPSSGDPTDPLGVGFLVKTNRVDVLNVDTVGADVNDRPSVALRARIHGPSTSLPQTVTIVVNQLEPLAGVGLDDSTGASVRARRQAQAESLANYLQGLQINDPNQAIVSIGDYNAFDFNDGYVDVVGTVLGQPAQGDQVVLASPPLVSPALVNLDDANVASERYSAIADGNAEPLDHALASANLANQFVALKRVRVNADFPEMLHDDVTTAARFSDRDPLVAYFAFPPDVEAPVFNSAPQDVGAEATSQAGAVVNYDTPTATDNLDPSVAVLCAPASGSTFPIGTTGVACVATDAAGNSATQSFSVTITPPVFGHMIGVGTVMTPAQRAWFGFDARESPDYRERGWIVVQVRDGHGRPDRYLSAIVIDVRFTTRSEVVFSGVGSWNGAPGYRYEISAADNSVAGPRHDRFALKIFAPNGAVVEDIDGTLHDGSIRSER